MEEQGGSNLCANWIIVLVIMSVQILKFCCCFDFYDFRNSYVITALLFPQKQGKPKIYLKYSPITNYFIFLFLRAIILQLLRYHTTKTSVITMSSLLNHSASTSLPNKPLPKSPQSLVQKRYRCYRQSMEWLVHICGGVVVSCVRNSKTLIQAFSF